MNLENLRDVAVEAARAGARVATEWTERGDAIGIETKGFGDYVTLVDRAAEQAVLEVLHRTGIPVRAEESGGDDSASEVWLVDPIDGTTNFLRGFPMVGVSVGLRRDGMPVAGAVAAPFLGRMWSAARGLGAHDDRGRSLHTGGPGGRGVVATGFPFRRPDNWPRYHGVLDAALAEFEDLRRAGAASLDLVYSAQGSFDGYFELGLSPWDIAAGSILVLEAGGVVTDWQGDPLKVYQSGDILAGAPHWHERMLEIVRTASPAAR